jgi:hypothetical protein
LYDPCFVAYALETAHLNLRDEYLPYRHLIGRVIIDVSFFSLAILLLYDELTLHFWAKQKNPGIETVVNKLDTIDNEFRFFKMEVLAGRPDFNVETVWLTLFRLCLDWTTKTSSYVRPNAAAPIGSTFPKYIGTRGCRPSTLD